MSPRSELRGPPQLTPTAESPFWGADDSSLPRESFIRSTASPGVPGVGNLSLHRSSTCPPCALPRLTEHFVPPISIPARYFIFSPPGHRDSIFLLLSYHAGKDIAISFHRLLHREKGMAKSSLPFAPSPFGTAFCGPLSALVRAVIFQFISRSRLPLRPFHYSFLRTDTPVSVVAPPRSSPSRACTHALTPS